MLKRAKVIGVLVLSCIAAISLLVGCASSEQQIKDALTREISSLASADELPSVPALEEFSDMGVDVKAVVSNVLAKTNAEVSSVKVDSDSATALISLKCPDISDCASLLSSKADELATGDAIVDMDKTERFARALQDLNESLEAAQNKIVEVPIDLSNANGKWTPGESVASAIVGAIFSDEDASQLANALQSYRWQFDDMNASQIVEQLKADGLPIGEIEVFDETSDPNGRLGRPGYYTSKATYWDNRIENPYNLAHTGGHLDNGMGGTVEVFSNTEDCKTRDEYLQNVTSASGIGRMYSYRFGNVLLRVSLDLLPSQAAEYETAFRAMQGQS